MKQIFQWRHLDGSTVGPETFTRIDLAVASLKFATHKMEEKPLQLDIKSRDWNFPKNLTVVEAWESPKKAEHGITWERLILTPLELYDEVVHL